MYMYVHRNVLHSSTLNSQGLFLVQLFLLVNNFSIFCFGIHIQLLLACTDMHAGSESAHMS